MVKCSICGKDLKNPNAKSHINSKFHQDALKKLRGGKARDLSKLVNVSTGVLESGGKVSQAVNTHGIELAINKIKDALNKSINYNNKKFDVINRDISEINKRLIRIEEALHVRREKDGRKRININKEKLLVIIKKIAKMKEGKYISFYELREYIGKWYRVENRGWERILEELKDEGKVEFSKGAKYNERDEGYRDRFNKVYYYFKLV
ncbi:MAG: hypothetical protein ACTSPY_04050 [Candidatus Helarchaeota archaeon]